MFIVNKLKFDLYKEVLPPNNTSNFHCFVFCFYFHCNFQALVALLRYEPAFVQWKAGNPFRDNPVFKKFFAEDTFLTPDYIEGREFLSVTDTQHILSRMRAFVLANKGTFIFLFYLSKIDLREFS